MQNSKLKPDCLGKRALTKTSPKASSTRMPRAPRQTERASHLPTFCLNLTAHACLLVLGCAWLFFRLCCLCLLACACLPVSAAFAWPQSQAHSRRRLHLTKRIAQVLQIADAVELLGQAFGRNHAKQIPTKQKQQKHACSAARGNDHQG